MNKRATIAFFVIGLGLVCVALAFVLTRPTLAQEGDGEEAATEAAQRGSVLYAQYCAACHGPQGEAIGSAPAFAAIQDYNPNFARGRILNGYDSDLDDGLAMPGYGSEASGPLSSAEVGDLLAYMATWNDPAAQTPPLPEPRLEPGPREVSGPGDPAQGASVYANYCLGCHGLNAQGVEGADSFPGFSINENTVRVAATGDGHEEIPAFAANNGGPLTDEQLLDLQTYLNTIEIEVEEEGPQGVSILLIVLGLGAVLAVGGAYMASRRAGA